MGRQVSALIDTDATIDVMSLDLARYLNVQPDPSTRIQVRHANGRSLSEGRLTLPLTLLNTTIQFTPQVLINPPHHIIIGRRAAQQLNLHIDCVKSQVTQVTPVKLEADEMCLPAQPEDKPLSPDISKLLKDYSEIFSSSSTDLNRITGASHVIRLHPDSQPIAQKPYRSSGADKQEIQTQVQSMLKTGLVRPSHSPWASPVTLADKKDGSRRFCVDYRKLNAMTVDEREPLPLIQDVLDQLGTSRIFTTLDLASGYWQVPLAPESIEKSAFVTPDGQYEWLVMPFGLKNAPPTFQRIIRRVLGDLIGHGVLSYLDDVIIYSQDFSSHMSLLKEVFQKLSQAKVKLKMSKCHFAQPEVEYLGFVIGNGQAKPSPAKTQAVSQFTRPSNVKEIQRFLGLANYYRRLVPDFSKTAEPLTRLTRKDQPFTWLSEQEEAFQSLKSSLTAHPVVALYQPDKPVILHTDASKIGIGAILMQPDDQGVKHVVAYYSRRLNPAEERYSASEQECLAVVESLEHFHVYVHGKHVEIQTDHSALQWLFSIKNPSSRLFRWSIRMSVYKYTIKHRAGSKNEAPDALSRAPQVLCISPEELSQAQVNYQPVGLKTENRDGILITRRRGLIRSVVPPNLRSRILKHYHDEHAHPGADKTARLIFARYYWPQANDEIVQYVKSCKTCQLVKISNTKPLGVLQPIPTPSMPNEIWAMDTMDMGRAAAETAEKNILLVVDHHSRHAWAKPTKNDTGQTAVNYLSTLVNALEPPDQLITDRGKNYTSKQFESYCTMKKMKHVKTSGYHPQANGLCERTNGTVITGLRMKKLDHPRKKWTHLLQEVLHAYNTTPHSATGFSPRFLHFGIRSESDPDIPLEQARQIAINKSDLTKDKRKQSHDENHKPSNFIPGALVLRKTADNNPSLNKLSPRYSGPYKVIRVLGPETYELKLEDQEDANMFPCHSSQLKEFHPRQEFHGSGGVWQAGP